VKAWVVAEPRAIDDGPLALVERPTPEPGPHEIRVRVAACGVCRTDLHLAVGELAPKHPAVVPGHEVVGTVDAVGASVARFRPGDRAGIAWLRHTCGQCRWCRSGRENLCPFSRYTGWDADGGYAEWAVVDERYAYALPDAFDDVHAAPLLCAGIVGYRALKRAALPPGGRLGIYGFGASAHLVAQVALAQGASVHVLTRSEAAQEHARELGVASIGAGDGAPPEPLDSAILFAPAGGLVPRALQALDRGGTLSVAGIYLTEVPALDYERDLFQERELRSVTSNTRGDGDEFLRLAANIGMKVRTTTYPLDRADAALRDLAHDRLTGAAVLVPA
jgi:alcohol dehydrogenase, propanol-preferring